MSKLTDLRHRDIELRTEIDNAKRERAAIGNSAVKENRKLTDEERTHFADLGDELTRLDAKLAASRDALIEEEAAVQHEAETGISADPDTHFSQLAASRAGLGSAPTSRRSVRATGSRFAEMFGASLGTSLDGWDSPGEYLSVVSRGLHDGRLRADAQTGETGSSGGYAVPTQLWGTMLDSALESEIVRPRATVFPMATRDLVIPSWDDLDRSGGAIADLDPKVEGEVDTADLQVAKVRSINLHALKHLSFVEASNELLPDSTTFAETLTRLMAKALSFDLDQQFLFGTGAAGAQGALVSAAAISINREVGSQISYTDMTNLFSRMTPGSVSRSVWVASPSTIPQLTQMSVAVGTGGSHVPAMQNANGEFTILTRPVIFSEKCPALGTKSDLSLCDFSQYAIGIRRDASLDRSGHIGFAKDTETFRLQARVAG